MRHTRIALVAAAFALVAAACGGDSGDTTTTAAPDTGDTTAATEGTTAPETTTTTEAPATTTTTTEASDDSTTTTSSTAPSGNADELVAAKTAAAQAVLPEDWESEITEGFEVDTGTDDVFSVCTDSESFDVAELESFTLAVSTLMADGPPAAGSFFPGGTASVEARVFEDADIAADAFDVLEAVFGTDEGRQCLTDEFLSEMTADLPVGDESFAFEIVEVDVPGADVGIGINISMEIEGLALGFMIELVAGLDGDCTVYATFLSFGDPFDPDLRNELFAAATSV